MYTCTLQEHKREEEGVTPIGPQRRQNLKPLVVVLDSAYNYGRAYRRYTLILYHALLMLCY